MKHRLLLFTILILSQYSQAGWNCTPPCSPDNLWEQMVNTNRASLDSFFAQTCVDSNDPGLYQMNYSRRNSEARVIQVRIDPATCTVLPLF
jgi:hypothetical protein